MACERISERSRALSDVSRVRRVARCVWWDAMRLRSVEKWVSWAVLRARSVGVRGVGGGVDVLGDIVCGDE